MLDDDEKKAKKRQQQNLKQEKGADEGARGKKQEIKRGGEEDLVYEATTLDNGRESERKGKERKM